MKTLWRDPVYVGKMVKDFSSVKEKMATLANNQLGRISNIQKTLYSLLNDLGIKYEPEKLIGYYSFDCFLPDHNILIECQGDYWHNRPEAIATDKAKATYIKEYFPQYKLVYIWEHEFKTQDLVLNLLKYLTGSQQQIVDYDFDKLAIKQIDSVDCELFVSKYHYAGRIGKATINYGAFLGDVLVAACVFSPITRQESSIKLDCKPQEMKELSRFCVHPQYQKHNLASWMISRCIKEISNNKLLKYLISFSDETFNHIGTIYKASNWKHDGMVAPSYWYVNDDSYVMHKKTLWDHAKKMGMGENEYAEKYGYKKVNGKEKHRYVYKLL
jgi:GNAT superfamily N-acetyltransferase